MSMCACGLLLRIRFGARVFRALHDAVQWSVFFFSLFDCSSSKEQVTCFLGGSPFASLILYIPASRCNKPFCPFRGCYQCPGRNWIGWPCDQPGMEFAYT
ncbi:hypothetical protein GGR55DRAFT_644896 [Xylaria sp. FL0064]|nr:hypothetical protein GGR55DRAFT_644896 [Xylaria sp. FL0064]